MELAINGVHGRPAGVLGFAALMSSSVRLVQRLAQSGRMPPVLRVGSLVWWDAAAIPVSVPTLLNHATVLASSARRA